MVERPTDRDIAMWVMHVEKAWPLKRVAAAFLEHRATVAEAVSIVEPWAEGYSFDQLRERMRLIYEQEQHA